ncbi:MAG: hypothetical protein C9356_12900 [Oleiphilus sp.]|nr:MAG: hypothetical protein C9356_12900 [Oleiphilus sp.]
MRNTFSLWQFSAGFLITSFLAMASCHNAPEQRKALSELRIGLLPDRDPELLKAQHKPLFEYISANVGKPYTFVVPDSYQQLVDLFENQSIDLAFFGGYTFVKAHKTHRAVPLVMRDIDRSFLSVIIARKDSQLSTLEDLRGQSFSFGSRLSTSGHLMPRYYLSKLDIRPERYFSDIRFSQAHNKTLDAVVSGQVKAGVLNANVFNQILETNPDLKETLQVIWQTAPYPNYVWAGQPYLSEQFRIDLRTAFLMLERATPEGEAILAPLNARSFILAETADFEELDAAIQLLEQEYE